MSQHSSLRSHGGKRRQHRNVLKRRERIEKLSAKGKWNENDSAFGLPKVKSQKVRISKRKAPESSSATPAVTS